MVRRWVITRFPDIENGSVLDIGCGTGAMLRIVHEKRPGMKLTGIDVSPDMLAIARRNAPKTKIIEADIAAIVTPPQNTFDAVLSLNVLHHLDDADAHLAILKKICKPGGTVFLCDFSIDTIRMRMAGYWWGLRHPSYRKAFAPRRLRRMIAAAGLTITDHAILTPDWFWRLQIYHLKA